MLVAVVQSQNVASRQETLARLQENVEVAWRRCRSATTFVEGLVSLDEWQSARRSLMNYLAESLQERSR